MARGSLKNSAETKVFLDNSNKNKENLLSTDLTNEIAKGYISGKKNRRSSAVLHMCLKN